MWPTNFTATTSTTSHGNSATDEGTRRRKPPRLRDLQSSTVYRMKSVMDIVDEILSVDRAYFLKWTPQASPSTSTAKST